MLQEELEFRKVSIGDKDRIKEFFFTQQYAICDFTLGGLFMWVDFFHYERCFYENFLFIRGRDVENPEEWSYFIPLGGDLMRGISILQKYVHDREKLDFLVLHAVPESVHMLLMENFECTSEYLPNWSDYVFDSKNLAFLEGHKFGKKRNLVNQFLGQYPKYRFEIINMQNINFVIEENAKYILANEQSELAYYEAIQTGKVLRQYFQFGFLGAVLFVQQKVVGFCFGEVIGDTLYIHTEKADTSFIGSYQMINQQYAKLIYNDKNIKYINREEDVGHPGLRKAKMSYFPVFIQKKHRVVIKYGNT